MNLEEYHGLSFLRDLCVSVCVLLCHYPYVVSLSSQETFSRGTGFDCVNIVVLIYHNLILGCIFYLYTLSYDYIHLLTYLFMFPFAST